MLAVSSEFLVNVQLSRPVPAKGRLSAAENAELPAVPSSTRFMIGAETMCATRYPRPRRIVNEALSGMKKIYLSRLLIRKGALFKKSEKKETA